MNNILEYSITIAHTAMFVGFLLLIVSNIISTNVYLSIIGNSCVAAGILMLIIIQYLN